MRTSILLIRSALLATALVLAGAAHAQDYRVFTIRQFLYRVARKHFR